MSPKKQASKQTNIEKYQKFSSDLFNEFPLRFKRFCTCKGIQLSFLISCNKVLLVINNIDLKYKIAFQCATHKTVFLFSILSGHHRCHSRTSLKVFFSLQSTKAIFNFFLLISFFYLCMCLHKCTCACVFAYTFVFAQQACP